ncbi:MAG: response regulator [Acidobacteriota bacterium]|nr:response regulator [Acidobacteriota bacterium]
MSTKRILVVDDEAAIIELLRDVLTGQGYEVDSATIAEEALDLVHDTIYDAAIVDFNLPDMNGVTLHRQIRQMDEELGDKTLFTSGMMQSEKNIGYYSAHGMGFLTKPFEVQDVLDALDRMWTGKY